MKEYSEYGIETESSLLCLTDFSKSSDRALRWSIQMAEQMKAHITILHTFRLLQSHVNALKLKQECEQRAQHDFQALEKNMLQGHAVTYEFKSEVGFIIDRIEDYATKHTIDLLVISKELGDENKEIFEDLVHRTKMPFAIIP